MLHEGHVSRLSRPYPRQVVSRGCLVGKPVRPARVTLDPGGELHLFGFVEDKVPLMYLAPTQ